MSKFTFICEESNEILTDSTNNHKNKYEFTGEYLPDILKEFEYFLRGCSYYFDGELEFVTEGED